MKAITKSVKNYFEKKKCFFLQFQVVGPYDGCIHEPNILLVCPEENENGFCSQSLVKGLYASGQVGVQMMNVKSIEELLTIIETGKVPGCPSWQEVYDFEVTDASLPINEATSMHETFWVHAVRVADTYWGIALKWRCEGCEKIIEGGDYEARPEHTSYRGNGGVGVIYEGALCQDCLSKGICEGCGRQAETYEEYNLDMATEGYDLCELCTSKLLYHAVFGEEIIDHDSLIIVQWYKDESQLDLPGLETGPVLRIMTSDRKPIEGLRVDRIRLRENIKRDRNLNGVLGFEHGSIFIKGLFAANIGYRNLRDEEEYQDFGYGE